jgi:hypothetical protein
MLLLSLQPGCERGGRPRVGGPADPAPPAGDRQNQVRRAYRSDAEVQRQPPDADTRGDFEETAMATGEAAGRVDEVPPAAEIVRGSVD